MRQFAAGACLLAMLASTGCGDTREDEPTTLPGALPGLPDVYTGSGYVSSEACAPCHELQHETWSRTFHRSMTQVATPETVAGPFENVSMSSAGRNYDLRREDDEFWVEYDDPDWDPDSGGDPPRLDRRVIMLTGSHYEQRIWVAGDSGNALDLLPIAYQIAEGRWVTQRDLFVSSFQGQATVRPAEWNDNCVRCHSTGGQPRTHLDEPHTRAGELTIACEACHGPGRDHVDAFSSAQPPAPGDDAFIVNPVKLEPEVSAQICGQCHSNQSTIDWPRWQREGAAYRPGGDLSIDRRIVRYASEVTEDWQEDWLRGTPSRMDSKFWSDGSILPSGREYNGLLESACFKSGTMSCVSCHTGHTFDDPDKLLSADMRTDHMCQQCHQEYAGDAQAEHSHHDLASPGSRCQNCHMPHTSWGMLRAAASHRIDSPTVASDRDSGRPNACNQCHVDRSLAWTASRLEGWYGIEPPLLAEQEGEVSANVRALIAGTVVQRAFAAWAMGWPAARQASGEDWMAPLLAQLLDDPISAVRLVAHRSLRTLPDFDQLDYDFDGPASERAQAAEAVEQAWRPSASRSGGDTAVLMKAGGELDRARLQTLLEARDGRVALIGE